MSTSKVSSPLKYSIATFLLCASALATEVFIYPVGLAIFNATTIPILFAVIASASVIVALSSAIYLVKSTVSAINDKKLEEKSNGNDVSTETPVVATVSPSLSAPDSKEPITNDDISTKTPKESPVTLGTAILQVLPTNVPTPPTLPSPIAAPAPPPLPNQDVSLTFTPPPSPKTNKPSGIGNGSQAAITPELLREFKLKKVSSTDRSTKQQSIADSNKIYPDQILW